MGKKCQMERVAYAEHLGAIWIAPEENFFIYVADMDRA